MQAKNTGLFGGRVTSGQTPPSSAGMHASFPIASQYVARPLNRSGIDAHTDAGAGILPVHDRCQGELERFVFDEAKGWPGDTDVARRATLAPLGLVREASSNAFIVVGPRSTLASLREPFPHSLRMRATRPHSLQELHSLSPVLVP